MVLIIVFLSLAVVVFLVIKVVRKEAARRAGSALKEEQFLAAMRANPRGDAPPSKPDAAVAPLLSPKPVGQAVVTPIESYPGRGATETPIPDITPGIHSSAPIAAPGPVPAAPLAAPRDGHCMICHEAVDVRSNDQSRWGVKVQEPGHDRLAWIHLQCLARRMSEVESLRETLVTLVAALDAALTGGAKEGQASGGAQSLKQALEKAHQLLGSAPAG